MSELSRTITFNQKAGAETSGHKVGNKKEVSRGLVDLYGKCGFYFSS